MTMTSKDGWKKECMKLTIEEAREYWSNRLEHAEGVYDEYMSAKERRIQDDYIDAMKHAITALAIYREREEAAKKPKTNGDCIRNMLTDEYIVKNCFLCIFR